MIPPLWVLAGKLNGSLKGFKYSWLHPFPHFSRNEFIIYDSWTVSNQQKRGLLERLLFEICVYSAVIPHITKIQHIWIHQRPLRNICVAFEARLFSSDNYFKILQYFSVQRSVLKNVKYELKSEMCTGSFLQMKF